MNARDLTRGGLIRALRPAVAALPAIDAALRAHGDAIAERAEAAGVDAHVVRRGRGRHAVVLRGPGLFARTFGSVDAPADGAIGTIAARTEPGGG